MAKEKKEPKLEKKTKQEKFIELAEGRVPKAIKQLTMVGNLSDKSKFEYTDKQVKQIYEVLHTALDQMKVRFEDGEAKDETFSCPDNT
ncbi:hypothetical protein ACH42_06370 [Endozoicomonas sp. (ex Bugula neritina AB1)]|nr:hypothetical protein ACH42_06370 [Endozoicomonas sp. (ex Bugula neritina AB1)]